MKREGISVKGKGKGTITKKCML